MLNRRGIALETAVALIMGIVFLVVVLFIVLGTGLLSAFQNQFYGLICTSSSYARGILVGLIMAVWSIVSLAIEIVVFLSGNVKSGLVALTKSAIKKLLREQVGAGLGAGVFALIALLSVSLILTYLAVLPLISNIPLFCPSVTIDVGVPGNEVTLDKFHNEFSSATSDCWNMYGAGALDPLIGVDPPNPRLCRVLEAYIKSPTNPKTVHDYMLGIYQKNWPFGSDRIFAYCYLGGNLNKLSNDVSTWGNQCQFDKARIYVMFRDKHEYDLLSYGTSVCGGQISEDDFGDVGDSMVWCIERI
jgi:hypothetical protein